MLIYVVSASVSLCILGNRPSLKIDVSWVFLSPWIWTWSRVHIHYGAQNMMQLYHLQNTLAIQKTLNAIQMQKIFRFIEIVYTRNFKPERNACTRSNTSTLHQFKVFESIRNLALRVQALFIVPFDHIFTLSQHTSGTRQALIWCWSTGAGTRSMKCLLKLGNPLWVSIVP